MKRPNYLFHRLPVSNPIDTFDLKVHFVIELLSNLSNTLGLRINTTIKQYVSMENTMLSIMSRSSFDQNKGFSQDFTQLPSDSSSLDIPELLTELKNIKSEHQSLKAERISIDKMISTIKTYLQRLSKAFQIQQPSPLTLSSVDRFFARMIKFAKIAEKLDIYNKQVTLDYNQTYHYLDKLQSLISVKENNSHQLNETPRTVTRPFFSFDKEKFRSLVSNLGAKQQSQADVETTDQQTLTP